jgi:hypothetical protein
MARTLLALLDHPTRWAHARLRGRGERRRAPDGTGMARGCTAKIRAAASCLTVREANQPSMAAKGTLWRAQPARQLNPARLRPAAQTQACLVVCRPTVCRSSEPRAGSQQRQHPRIFLSPPPSISAWTFFLHSPLLSHELLRRLSSLPLAIQTDNVSLSLFKSRML